MSKVDLKLDWCSYEAAKYAVEKWHYSRVMPSCGANIGVWEEGKFVGAVCFGVGAANVTRGEKYGLARSHEIAELMRVALTKHKTPTSRIITIACKMLKKQSPGLRMLISFADEMRCGHHGGIYQAAGWLYAGVFDGDVGFVIKGKTWHSKSVHSAGWKQTVEWLRKHVDPNCVKAKTKKHRYLFPLDVDIAQRIEPLRKPYPKRADSVTQHARLPAGVGGSTPTSALQSQP